MTGRSIAVRYVLTTSVLCMLCAAPDASVSGRTEVEGGTPAPAADPTGPIKRYDPKSTSTFTDYDSFAAATWCVTVPVESFEELEATNQTDQESVAVPGFTITTDTPPRL